MLYYTQYMRKEQNVNIHMVPSAVSRGLLQLS